jgi:hypothetical protein
MVPLVEGVMLCLSRGADVIEGVKQAGGPWVSYH